MTDKNEELKTCPYCGNQPIWQKHPDFGLRLFCDMGYDHAIFIGGANRQETINNWNNRTPDKTGLVELDEDLVFGLLINRFPATQGKSVTASEPKRGRGKNVG